MAASSTSAGIIDFHTIHSCLSNVNTNVEWFYVNWVANDERESGICCFFLTKVPSGEVGCNVLLVKHDLKARSTAFVTYLHPKWYDYVGDIVDLNSTTETTASSPSSWRTIRKCMDAVFARGKGKGSSSGQNNEEFLNHVVQEANFSSSVQPFSLVAHGFELRHKYSTSGMDTYELLIPQHALDNLNARFVREGKTGASSKRSSDSGSLHGEPSLGMRILFTPEKPVVDLYQGVVKSQTSEFNYLAYTRGKLDISSSSPSPSGSTAHPSADHYAARGEFDHQWGRLNGANSHWLWFACWLDDGREVFYYNFSTDGDSVIRIIGADGSIESPVVTSTEITKWWTSPSSLQKYPVALKIRYNQDTFILQCSHDDQEVETAVNISCFYEGTARCEVRQPCVAGTADCDHQGHKSVSVRGMAFIECVNRMSILDKDGQIVSFGGLYANYKEWLDPLLRDLMGPVKDNSEFLKRAALPSAPDFTLLGTGGFEPFNKNIVDPFIYSSDGSAWRAGFLGPFTRALTCKKYHIDGERKLSPLIEIPQTACLMIDDKQDKADTRRGKVCAYLKYGEDITFLSALGCEAEYGRIIEASGLPDHTRLAIYKAYSETQRQLFIGQSEDISYDADNDARKADVRELMEFGESSGLRDRMSRQHALKTGAPLAFICKLAGIIAEYDESVMDTLYMVGLELGTAYQLYNDLLDYDLNSDKLGGDVKARKITYPMLMALKNMPKEKRVSILDIISIPMNEPLTQDQVMTVVNTVNEFDGTTETKREMVTLCEKAWSRLVRDVKLPTSVALFEISMSITCFLQGSNWDPDYLHSAHSVYTNV